MSWKVIKASVIGTSHINSGQSCQDDCYADVITRATGSDYLICIISDGAGSAREAGRGAELTCVTAIKSIEYSLSNLQQEDLNENLVVEWVKDIRRAIYAEAEDKALSARDFACTLLGAVVGQDIAIFFQLGDGAIVVSSHFVQGVVFWPDSGQYANMTYFITEEDALDHLQVFIKNTQIDELALFSDGIQRLALSFQQRTPHVPFFDPMFNILRKCHPDEYDIYNHQLEQFLNSSSINERTDDDKTLILATRKNA
jgi:hypothetical protein